MLEITGISSPKRLQFVRMQKKMQKTHQPSSNLLNFDKVTDVRPNTPSYREF